MPRHNPEKRLWKGRSYRKGDTRVRDLRDRQVINELLHSRNRTEKKMDIKEMVRGDQKVKFIFYRKGELWYEHSNGFKFPVPISDAGDAQFLAEDKAMLFMRYIRKEIAARTEPPMSELPITL